MNVEQSERAPARRKQPASTVAPLVAAFLPLAGGLVVAACFWWVIDLTSPFVIDDTFISFRYAENLARGQGLVYNPGERVEGYTNFLWVLLIAAAYALGGDSLAWSKILGTAANAVTLALVGWAAQRWWPRPALPGLALLPPLLLAVNFGFVLWGVGGLETALFVALATAGLLRLVAEAGAAPAVPAPPGGRWAPLRRLSMPWAALLFALATLARPDGVVLFAGGLVGWGLWAFLVQRPEAAARRALPARWLLGGAVYSGIVGAHFLFRYAYYGAWVPNTVYTKVTSPELFRVHWDRLIDWVRGWGIVEPRTLAWLDPVLGLPPCWNEALALLTTPALALALVGLIAGRRQVWAWVLGAASAVWLVYLGCINPDWMPGWRFFVPITPAVVLLIGAGLERLARAARRLPGAGGRLMAVGIAGVVGALVLFSAGEVVNQRAPVVAGHTLLQRGYRAAGEYLRRHAPPGATLAAIDAGAIPYYSGLYTIDYSGLADTHIARVPYRPMSLDKGDGILRYYPALRSDPAYLLGRRPDFVQLGGHVLPDGRHIGHQPEMALVYQAMLQEGTYDTAHPVLYDEPLQLILVKRYDTPWNP